jgi:hypothetical protein
VLEQVSKTGPSRGLVLGAYVVPHLNINHGRLVVFDQASLKTIWEGQGSNRRLREGDGFANPREKEKSEREDDDARYAGWMEDARQPAPNLEGSSLQIVNFIIDPHEVMK